MTMMILARPIRTLGLGCFGIVWLTSCATPVHIETYPNQQRMIGVTKAAVLACAVTPKMEIRKGEFTLLRYYREAPILEESQPIGKSSVSTIRHGCWATVIVADNRVIDVQYRYVPTMFDASNDCEAIFESCMP